MFLNYCTYACRTVVFLAIVFMIGYVMVKNEKNIEKFVADRIQGSPYQSSSVTRTQRETITTVFRNYLNRDPTEEEIEMMSRLMLNPNDVLSIVDAVKATDEYKHLIASTNNNHGLQGDEVLRMSDVAGSPLLRDLQKVDLDTRMDTYRKVIDEYQRVLERMPTNKELTYYAHKMLTDPQFTESRLGRVLEGSSEYKIIQKNQNNIVNGELPGNITDAQLTMDVVKKYKSVFGADPNADTIDFLKAKYTAYKLDEIRFDNLLILLKQMDDNQYSVDGKSGEVTLKIQRNEEVARKLAARKEFADKNMNVNEENASSDQKSKVPKGVPSSQLGVDSALYNEIGDIEESINRLSNNPATSAAAAAAAARMAARTKSAPNATDGKGNCPYTDPFYKRLAAAQGNSCNFNGDVPSFDRDLYSEYQSKRNEDELMNACKRSSYYLGVEKDLFKDYDVKRTKEPAAKFDAKPVVYSTEPADAAGLVEARNTSVGSILPQFIYGEL